MAYILILADSDEREIHDGAKHEKLKSVLDELELKASPVYVSVNGKRKRYWKNYVPQEGDIVFCYFEERHVFSAVFITAGIITLAMASSVMAVAFGVGLLGIGIGLLVNHLFSNDTSTGNNNYSANSDSLKNVSGTDMQINAGSKVPLQFGGTWYRPDLLCEPYTYVIGTKSTGPDGKHWGYARENDGVNASGQGGVSYGKSSGTKNVSPVAYIGNLDLHWQGSCCVGYSDDVAAVAQANVLAGDSPLADISGSVQSNSAIWDSCLVKQIDQQINTIYNKTVTAGITASVPKGTATTHIELEFYVQQQYGYDTDDGQPEFGRIVIDYSLAFNDGGTYAGWIRVYSRRLEPFLYRIYIPATGAYRIKITTIKGEGFSKDSALVCNFSIRQLRFIFDKTKLPILRGGGLRALSIQLQNSVKADSSNKKILALCRATWQNCVSVANAVAQGNNPKNVAKYTCSSGKGSPADAILYAAISEHCLGTNKLSYDQIDLNTLADFRKYCAARDYNYVASVTNGRAFQDLIMHIALVGHSRMAYDKYGRLTIITDDYYDSNYNSIAAPVVCLINSTNTIKDSWKVTKSNIDYSQKPTVLRINFVDHNTRQESVGYVFLDARRYYKSSTVSAANLKTFDQVVNSIDYTKDVVTTISIDDYEGIRDPKHVFEMGRRQILKQYYTTTEVTFTMGIQANGLAMWDRVWLGHTLLANSIVSGKIIEKTVNGNTVTLRLDRAILYEIPSTLDDAQLRDINAPRSQIIINHIDLANSSNSFNRSYTMTTSPSNDFVVTLTVASNDPLKTVEIGEQDVYSIANGYFDGIIVGRKPKDDKMTELTVTDYLFDATCTPSNPFTTYNTAARLKYGNPYWTYKETVPHFWGNSVSNNP